MRPILSVFWTAACLLADEKVNVEYFPVSREVIQQRLERVAWKFRERRATIESLFHEVGCGSVVVQKFPFKDEPNITCTLSGDGVGSIVVGAHYDFANRGIGAVDDWSGASLLASLYQSLSHTRRHHDFVFVAFAAEEHGLLGSKAFVKHLSADEHDRIRAMINLECLGLSRPAIWGSRADPKLMAAYLNVAKLLGVPPRSINADRVGDDDSHPFKNAGIPVLTVHSITQETFRILHSPDDNLKALKADDYYQAYRLAAILLAYLDASLN
jgi:hypothetical protein